MYQRFFCVTGKSNPFFPEYLQCIRVCACEQTFRTVRVVPIRSHSISAVEGVFVILCAVLAASCRRCGYPASRDEKCFNSTNSLSGVLCVFFSIFTVVRFDFSVVFYIFFKNVNGFCHRAVVIYILCVV